MIRYLLVISLLLNFQPQTANNKHLGKWAGDDGVRSGFLILDEEGYATLKADGQVMGGKSAVVGGVEAYMLYTIDYQSTPIEIDFIIHRLADDQEMGRLKGIVEFKGDNSLKLAMGFSGDRPEDFEGDDTLVFTRER